MVSCQLLYALIVSTSLLCADATGEDSLPVPDSSGQDPGVFPVQDNSHCFGQEMEQGRCPDLEPCADCEPVNCAFGDWEEWEDHGDCSGLKIRKREIATQENECGKPCDGPLTETAEHIVLGDVKCYPPQQFCSFSEWEDWSKCATPAEQKYRTRSFSYTSEKTANVVPADQCDKDVVETAPCSYAPGKIPVDCKFNAWGQWTECSTSCNIGWQSRVRTSSPPENGGKPCNGTLRESQMCNKENPCEAINCKFSQWSAWSGCNAESPYSKHRTRSIDIPSKNGGTQCVGATEETECCDFMIPSDCKMSDWCEWGGCSPQGACGAQGQSFRTRRVLSEPFNGGTCPDMSMQQTKPCPLPECTEKEEDCKLNDWEDWEACSATCGQGEKIRKRTFKEATGEGIGCTGNLTEVAACGSKTECDKADCVWNSWADWSDCTVSCGNGTQTRSRNIRISPRNGGKFCTAETKREVVPCSPSPCKDDCVNGTWTDWTTWTPCTTSCGPGYQTRHRQIAKHANECGTPATGASEEYQACNIGYKDVCNKPQDCVMAQWTEWGDCSASCFGHQFRSREVKEFARYGGKPCNDSIRDVTSCNPGPDDELAPKGCVAKEKDMCEFGEWEEWTKCTNCGGGFQRRDRLITNRPCQLKAGETEKLIETQKCPVADCPKPVCTDCTWSAWTEWSACSHCGDQKRRSRYIKTNANYCGKPCNQSAAVELAKCDSPCEDFYYCQWSEFTEGPPTASCGNAVKSRERHLHLVKEVKELPVEQYLFKGFKDAKCAGVEKSWVATSVPDCPKDCTAQDCVLADWSEWGDLGGGCMGLCQRNRGIKQGNNECGKPCNNTLTETKVCENKCNKTHDCEFCDWSEWTVCYSDFAQSTRVRSPIGCQDPECGGGLARGKVCEGPLKETRPCKRGTRDVDCEFAQWEKWGTCTVTCGGGKRQRQRFIKTAAEGIGAACTGSMNEVEECNTEKCSSIDLDCQMTDWGEWQDHCDIHQMVRQRNVTQASAGAGKPCTGPMVITAGCQPKKINCEMTDWNEWTTCDRTCGGGQRKQERIPKILPSNGGAPCPPEVQRIEGCSAEPCDPQADCEFGAWSAWSECTRECGGGQRNRTRTIKHEATPLGAGCAGTVKQVEGCGVEPCTKDVDCAWGEWNDWSGCSVSCGGGTHRRHRRIATFPIGQGKKCVPEDKEEIAPCKEDKCEACTDGSWGEWGTWTTCSATCGVGVSWRHRNVKQMASDCGAEPEGLSQELKRCISRPCRTDTDIDCKLQDWGDWHGCSEKCNGYRRRVRDIEVMGAGNGAFCQAEPYCKPIGKKNLSSCTPAPLEEFEGCNQEGASCEEEKPEEDQDCEFSAWSEWECPVTCGRGQALASRTVKTMATGKGKACYGVMKRTGLCQGPEGHPLPACNKGEEIVDCEYEEWGEWGDCSKCAGQKFRSRDIKTQAQNGGEACAPNATTEVMGCGHRECGKKHFCAWQDWQEWGHCDKTCGNGKRQRKRHLELTSKKAFSERMEIENADLKTQLDAQKDAHLREVVLAFSAGAACLVLAVFAFRLRQGNIGRPRRPSFEHASFE